MWRVLQLADSAFPAGGFAHSGGLEAAVTMGEVTDAAGVERFARAAVWQAASGALPLVRAAHAQPERVGDWDARCEATLVSQVARRASRTQGRAWLATCTEAFAELFAVDGDVVRLAAAVRGRAAIGHFCVVFGVTLRALEVERGAAERLYLHQTLRGVLSAGVRLGRLGPLEAQRVQARMSGEAEAALAATAGLGPDETFQMAPIEELFGALHDRLYSRLFQS